jgi:transposase
VRLVLDEGKTVSQVARDLDLTQSALGGWVKQARADRDGGKSGLTTEEKAELAPLRKEVRELRMARDILRNAVLLGVVTLAGCDEAQPLERGYSCRCALLSDTDLVSEQALEVCATRGSQANQVAQGCAQAMSRMSVQSCTCEAKGNCDRSSCGANECCEATHSAPRR